MTTQPKLVTTDYVVFSLKVFGAGMLAYWIALRFGLDNPYWAVGTVFIIANPLSGSITSRAIYRLLGTFLGAVATIVLVPNLVFSPILLSLGIALWCGFCLFVSLLDRTPRSYVFLLAGYTVALTGFTLVNAPETSFHVAVSRVEEIAVGILCAAIVSRAVFPRHAGKILANRVQSWLGNAAALSRHVLAGEGETAEVVKARHRLAADAVDLRNFTTYSGFEGADGRALRERMVELERHMVAILPLLSEITDTLAVLRRDDPDFDARFPLVGRVSAWIDTTGTEALAHVDALVAELDACRAELEAEDETWPRLVALRLTKRLRNLVLVWRDCRILRLDMASGETHALSRQFTAGQRRSLKPHTDYRTAFSCALAAVIAIMIACTLWIATGWTYGWAAAQMTAILCSVLATLDDARPALSKILQLILIATLAVFVYQFAILPTLTGFLPLVGALGLYLIPCGILLATPARWLVGFQLSVNLIYMLTLNDRSNPDFVTFAGSSLGTVFGILIAKMTLSTARAVGAEHGARRLLQSAWRTVIDAASGARRPDPNAVVYRMVDRFGLLAPRLASLPPGSSVLGNDILHDLRVSLDALKIQRNKTDLSEDARHAANALLTSLADHYRGRLADSASPPTDTVIASIDTCLRILLSHPGVAERRVKDALVGLRATLASEQDSPNLALHPQGPLYVS